MGVNSPTRRQFAIGALASFAGCLGGETNQKSTVSTSPAPTTSKGTPEVVKTPDFTYSEPPTETPTSTPAPSGVRSQFVEFDFDQWMVKRYLRYFDSKSDQLAKLWPSNDYWALTSLTVRNLGDEKAPTPDESDISFILSGQEYDPLSELPKSDWSDVRLREKYQMYWMDPTGYPLQTGPIEGGDARLYYTLWDVDSLEMPRLKVPYSSEQIILSPEHRIGPDKVL
jgi:hypothetical protein